MSISHIRISVSDLGGILHKRNRILCISSTLYSGLRALHLGFYLTPTDEEHNSQNQEICFLVKGERGT